MRLALLIVAALVAAVPALAHSWYPLACCGNMDCFPIACDQLVETVSAGSTFRPAICSSVNKCSRVRTTTAMCASDAALITTRSAHLSCRTCSGPSR